VIIGGKYENVMKYVGANDKKLKYQGIYEYGCEFVRSGRNTRHSLTLMTFLVLPLMRIIAGAVHEMVNRSGPTDRKIRTIWFDQLEITLRLVTVG